jgi:hypothetical protein
VTARAEISRLLAIFNALSENDKNIVLKISESIKKPEITAIQTQDGKCQIPIRREGDIIR